MKAHAHVPAHATQTLSSIQDTVKNFAVIYVVDTSEARRAAALLLSSGVLCLTPAPRACLPGLSLRRCRTSTPCTSSTTRAA